MDLSQVRWWRGCFRLWILLSTLWIFGTFYLFLQHGIETQELLGAPPPDQFGNQTTWMRISIAHNWPLFLIGPICLPFLAGLVWVVVAAFRWVGHGFGTSN